MAFIFKSKQVLAEKQQDTFTSGTEEVGGLSVLKIVGKGTQVTDYEIGDYIIVKNENARPVGEPFKKEHRLIYNSDLIICQYQK